MPSRRAEISMTEEEADQFARAQQTLIIVSNGHDGFPHPMPMWYAVDKEGRYLVSTFERSQKVVNYRRDARATLLIESGETYETLRGLVVKARTEILESEDDVLDAMVEIRLKNSDADARASEKLREEMRPASRKRVILRFTPESTMSWDHAKLGGRY
ncbi:MAG: pyridoxamine 5'-phosphate oxidase family protein [Gammaproteobacteria bacterium]|nr:pyridoxamine 5'-phosphate oxidase family protein [Gammaproteobacteria bacterium]MCY4277192.1 pyridoxamine 5'-phosphate oxidase family protein [Gammaproteobacteria bacterium]